MNSFDDRIDKQIKEKAEKVVVDALRLFFCERIRLVVDLINQVKL